MADPNLDNPRNAVYLEPRVAKLEVGMERLTDDVRNLAIVVREQGAQMEQEIQKLVIAVTQASGPRKTDWSTIIAGIMLVLAIGSAVFWPLNQTTQEAKKLIEKFGEQYHNHEALPLHPVGSAIVDRLEYQLKDHILSDERVHEELKTNFNDTIDSLSKYYEQKFSMIAERLNTINDRLYIRIVELEQRNILSDERERNELNKWRQKAMGLSDPSAYVPLTSRNDVSIE